MKEVLEAEAEEWQSWERTITDFACRYIVYSGFVVLYSLFEWWCESCYLLIYSSPPKWSSYRDITRDLARPLGASTLEELSLNGTSSIQALRRIVNDIKHSGGLRNGQRTKCGLLTVRLCNSTWRILANSPQG